MSNTSSTVTGTTSGSITSSTSNPGNNSNNNNSSSPGISNSATLYLYTFLATLVLLLGVSGAIVIRSLILRRRHRLMIEEAIRNGTYIPPNVLANSRGRVDPAKKPKMWEATVGAFGGEGKGKGGGGMIEKESPNGWDDIFPVSASISSMLPGAALSAPAATGDNTNTNTVNSTANADSSSDGVLRSNIQTIIRAPARLAVGAFRLISPGNNPTNSPSASTRTAPVDVESNPMAMSSLDPASPNFLTKRPPQVLPQPSASTPTHMQVAVLIAMPGALASIKSKSSSDGHGDDDEEEVPYVEVGTTEVVISPSASSPGSEEGSSSSGSRSSAERL